MRKHRFATWVCLLLSLLLAVVLLSAGCGPSDSPEATVDAFFKAVSEGDAKTMQGLVTGKAATKFPKPDSPAFKQVAALGKAYKGVVDKKVSGDKAQVWVKIDAQTLADAMAEVMGKAIKDPKVREKMIAGFKAAMLKDAKKLARAEMRLIKKDGKWLISEFVKK